MRSRQNLMRTLLSASLAVLVCAAPSEGGAQGKGKGGDKDQGRGGDARAEGKGRGRGRSEQRAVQQPRAVGRGSEQRDARPSQLDRSQPGDRGRDARGEVPRRETSSDQQIERKLEREFAGDVERVDRGSARGRFSRRIALTELRPSVRRFVANDRIPARVAAGAVARAHLRGLDDDDLVIVPAADRVRILNRSGLVLIDLDDDRARNLGRWDVIPLNEDVKQGAPSFCRSGAGHPVFGRQWCLDKGFGLGPDSNLRWGRTARLEDVRFLTPVSSMTLTRDAVLSLLGPVAYNRLALHAITLGLVDPLVGRWLGEPAGPRVLLLASGDRPVAEFVDRDRDDRADLMLVALRDW